VESPTRRKKEEEEGTDVTEKVHMEPGVAQMKNGE